MKFLKKAYSELWVKEFLLQTLNTIEHQFPADFMELIMFKFSPQDECTKWARKYFDTFHI